MAPPPDPLVSVRTALVLLIGAVVGFVAGAAGYFVYDDVAAAVLVGGGAAGSALSLSDRLFGGR